MWGGACILGCLHHRLQKEDCWQQGLTDVFQARWSMCVPEERLYVKSTSWHKDPAEQGGMAWVQNRRRITWNGGEDACVGNVLNFAYHCADILVSQIHLCVCLAHNSKHCFEQNKNTVETSLLAWCWCEGYNKIEEIGYRYTSQKSCVADLSWTMDHGSHSKLHASVNPSWTVHASHLIILFFL